MSDRRLHHRIPYVLSFDCNHYFDQNGVEHKLESSGHFSVDDISVGGMRAKCYAYFPEGCVLQFTLYLECIPYIILTRVRWSRPLDDIWSYGLEFLSIPNMLYRHLNDLMSRNKDPLE